MQVDVVRMVADWLIADLPLRLATAPVDPGEAVPPAWTPFKDSTLPNQVAWSEDLTQAPWVKTACSVTPTTFTDPLGNPTAGKLIDTVANVQHVLSTGGFAVNAAGTVSQLAALTVHVKAAEYARCRVTVSDAAAPGGNEWWADVNLTSLTVTPGTSGTGVQKGAQIAARNGGWFKIDVSGQLPAAATVANVLIYMEDANGNVTFAGTGTSGIGVWGVQLVLAPVAKQASFTTPPYQKTAGAAAASGWTPVFDETRSENAANFKDPPTMPCLYLFARAPMAFEGEPTPDGQIRKSRSPAPVAIPYQAANSVKQDAIRDGSRSLRAIARSLRELSKGVNEMARTRNGVLIVLGEGPQIYDPVVSAAAEDRVNGAISVGYYVRDYRPSY